MNAPGHPFEQLKAAEAKEARLTILLTGSTTVYTSSITNPLPNTRIIHVDTGKQGIIEIVIWNRFINNLPCRIITIPGLCHIQRDAFLDQACLEKIKASITPVHCIWLAARLNETALSQDEQNVIKWITTILGEQAWSYAIFVLTHANTIKDAYKRGNIMKNRSENMRAEISRYTGWDIAANITSVPVTALDEIIHDGKKWLPEFYEQVMRHCDPSSIFASSNPAFSSGNIPSVKKGLFGETSYRQKETVQPHLEDRLTNRLSYHWRAFICCYLSSTLVGAVGMCLYGPKGLAMGLTGNIVLWTLLKWVQTRVQSQN